MAIWKTRARCELSVLRAAATTAQAQGEGTTDRLNSKHGTHKPATNSYAEAAQAGAARHRHRTPAHCAPHRAAAAAAAPADAAAAAAAKNACGDLGEQSDFPQARRYDRLPARGG
eukprot:scaffold54379_cov63-Phaeocystis_antarctica.AAC.2